MEHVLDTYQRAYNPKEPVLNLDESPKQLIAEKRTAYTDKQGVLYQDYEYERQGVQDIYMIAEPKAGKREVLLKDNHNAKSYAEVILYIAEKMYPDADKITIVEDNLAAHKLSALYEIIPPKRARNIIKRIEIVRTPKHGSWLNIAELELSILTRQGLDKRVDTKEKLNEQVKQWYQIRNKNKSKINWTFKTKDARIKLKRLYPSFEP